MGWSQENGWEGVGGRERKRGKGKKGEKRSKREKWESLMEATMGMDPKYGVRSPKFIWAPCAQLYSLAETTQPPPPPSIYEGAIGYWSAKVDDISL